MLTSPPQQKNIINNMNTEKTYHIDVTPEEDALFNPSVKHEEREAKPPISFAKVFCVVLGVHAAIGAGVLATTHSAQAKQNDTVASQPQPVTETPKPVAIETPSPTPTPKPTPETVSNPVVAKTEIKNTEKYIKEYVVKQGDTLTSIAKKYKLSTTRLIKINNIKDVNKLTVGQKLKFL
jgi:LysM repeat protein